MLILPGNIRVGIMLHLLITLLMQGTKLGDNLLDARESPTRRFLHMSAFGEMDLIQ